MIVRIFGEAQYRLDDDLLGDLDELDDAVVASVERADEASFQDGLSSLLEFVRRQGDRLPDEELSPSDYILPPPDLTLIEARTEFTGEGLIPTP